MKRWTAWTTASPWRIWLGVAQPHRLPHVAQRLLASLCAFSQPSAMMLRTSVGSSEIALARARGSAPARRAPRRSPAACIRGSRCPRCGIPAAPIPCAPRRNTPGGTATPGTSRDRPGSVRFTRAGIGRHRADLLGDAVGILAQADRVVVGLRHLLPVEPRHLRRLGQQRLRLGQDHLAAAFEKTEQPLAIAQRQVLRLLEQRARRFERPGVALLRELACAAPDRACARLAPSFFTAASAFCSNPGSRPNM